MSSQFLQAVAIGVSAFAANFLVLSGNAAELTRVAWFAAPEAVQGVAVDDWHFIAIANRDLAKYDRRSGELVRRWSAGELPLIHMNSGIIRDGELFVAHSNFPDFPESSSIEVFDTESLTHQRSHALGIVDGSLTWIDWYDNAWWACFAHYSEKVNGNPLAKSTAWTRLVRFDASWRATGGWSFPKQVLARFEPHSSSGGGWGAGGELYVTGHDLPEVYVLRLPTAGSTLELVRTLSAPIEGQAICRDATNDLWWGIVRSRREVVAMKLANPAE